MKNILLLLSILVVTQAFAETDKAHPMDPKQMEMMKKMEAYGAPGESHKKLTEQEGNWTYTSKFWEGSKSEPQKSTGTSTFKSVLGGLWLEQDLKGQMMGRPFEGKGFIGFNNVTKKYETIWLDSWSSGMTHGTGTFDTKTNTVKDSGSYSCPISPSKMQNYRAEWTMNSKDSMTYSMFGKGFEKKEFKMMEIEYTRVK